MIKELEEEEEEEAELLFRKAAGSWEDFDTESFKKRMFEARKVTT